MAQDINRPFTDLTKYVPENLRNPVGTALLSNAFNQFLTNDESVQLFGYIGNKPDTESTVPPVPELNAERKINQLIPVLHFKVGTEVFTFTVQDLVNKAKAIGLDEDLSWLYSQGNNFLPPINLEKFTDYFQYYWVARALPTPPVLAWNETLSPEYYVIARPPLDADIKLPVRTVDRPDVISGVFTRTGSGLVDQVFTVTFTSATTFTISLSDDMAGAIIPIGSPPALIPGEVVTPVSFSATTPMGVKTLLTFDIVRDIIYDIDNLPVGQEEFVAGDEFVIDVKFITNSQTIAFAGSPGVKGRLMNVHALDDYQTLNGVQVREGDRVLVRGGLAADNGIYIVRPGEWVRAADFDVTTAGPDAQVWVSEGNFARSVFTSVSFSGGYNFIQTSADSDSLTSDWQNGNYWMTRSELLAAGYDADLCVQAKRPIIEYDHDLQLNQHTIGGVPAETGDYWQQVKRVFNQVPLFDLYRYDGTHAGLSSAIFFYVEDPEERSDVVLQRRVKRSSNDSADFIFDHGCRLGNTMLFFKKNDELKTVWHAGYTTGTYVDQTYGGTGDGTLAVSNIDTLAQQQVWTLVAEGPTTFRARGSKNKTLPDVAAEITVGVPFSNGLFDALITAGSTPFEIGDTFTFRVGGLESPRYVTKVDDVYEDIYGGEAADTEQIGAYRVSRTYLHNPLSLLGEEVTEGTLNSHFRSIMVNQPTGTTFDAAFGGIIKLWGEQHGLLASLLMQKDSTPTSIVDFAQRSYAAALNSVSDAYLKYVVDYFAQYGVVDPSDVSFVSDTRTPTVTDLTNWLLTQRSVESDIFADSTSPITGFPITLPQMGFTPLVEPAYSIDPELGLRVLTHHDGHTSLAYENTAEFRQLVLGDLLNRTVQRSDGTTTPVVRSTYALPVSDPYKGELWMQPQPNGTSALYAFDVLGDTAAPPLNPQVGDRWYDRPGDATWVWDGFVWAPFNKDACWTIVDFAAILNSVLWQIEQRLYDGSDPLQRIAVADPSLGAQTSDITRYLKQDLADWAALNSIDPYASTYSATDAFTWNYSLGSLLNFPPLSTATVPARWFDVLKAHQQTVAGVLPTAQPHIEPWKLIGHASRADWITAGLASPVPWSPAHEATVTPEDVMNVDFGALSQGNVVVVALTNQALSGLSSIDGVAVQAGDSVLLTAQTNPAENGAYVARVGAWNRIGLLQEGSYWTALQGSLATTTWIIDAPVPTPEVTPVSISQVRRFTMALWAAIQVARPTLRLGVYPVTEQVLPAYVSPTDAAAPYALTTALPPGPNLPFTFGQGSPAEVVWQKSIDYRYSLMKAYLRNDPLFVLGYCWGFDWFKVDGVSYAGPEVNLPSPVTAALHGQPLTAPARTFTLSAVTSTTTATVTIEKTGFDGTNQTFTVTAPSLQEYVTPGNVTINGPFGSYTFTIDLVDRGQPFSIGDKIVIELTPTTAVATFVPAGHHFIQGLGQIFTQSLRALSIDTDLSYAVQAYRGWTVNMGYRLGALISTEDAQLFNETETLSPTAYSLVLKRNDFVEDTWMQALRVVAIKIGSHGLKDGVPYALGDGSDWVFRVEGYNPRYQQITFYTLGTIPGVYGLPTFGTNGEVVFDHTTGLTYRYESSQWLEIENNELLTFNALEKRASDAVWYRSLNRLGTTTTSLPLIFTGVQNLVTFLYGYISYLQDDGWEVERRDDGAVDAETGRMRNWQLDVEKFIDRVFSGMSLGQGHVFSSFMDLAVYNTPLGLTSSFEDNQLFDVRANTGAFDVLGTKLAVDDLTVLRLNEKTDIRATVPMFSIHAQRSEFEHLLMLGYFSEPSTETGLLYQPFSSARVTSYRLSATRQATTTFRPVYPGHVTVDDTVVHNLAGSVEDLAGAYDAAKAYDNRLFTTHAGALLGFSDKDYFADLDVSDKTQFNFWRGLVHAKGTVASIDAFLNSSKYDDARVDEYWAFKVGEYGDARLNDTPELNLFVTDAQEQFTKLQFDVSIPALNDANFKQVLADDEARWVTIEDIGTQLFFVEEQVGTFTATFSTDGEVLALPFVADRLEVAGGTAINLTSVTGLAGSTVVVTGYGPAAKRHTPVKLLNHVAKELVEEVPFWHPAGGYHTPDGIEGINITSRYNPARYNYTTQETNNHTFSPLKPWGRREVGRTWWNTTNLAYVPYYDPTAFPLLEERLARWGALTDYATIDVWEWVESQYDPATYNERALEDAGNVDIDRSVRASGEAADSKTYRRIRQWMTRPIAWSYSRIADAGAHPALGEAGAGVTLRSFESTWWLNGATFDQLGITPGFRLGAFNWTPGQLAPLSEVLITDTLGQLFNDDPAQVGTFTTSVSVPPIGNTTTTTTIEADVTVAATGAAVYVGPITCAVEVDPTYPVHVPTDSATPTYLFTLVVTEVSSGDQTRVEISRQRGTGPEVLGDRVMPTDIQPGASLSVEVEALNLTFTVTSTAVQTVDGGWVGAALHGLEFTASDAVTVEDVATAAGFVATSFAALTNDEDDPLFTANQGIGWAAWQVPTQEQLDADSRPPACSWVPYVGGWSEPVSVTADLIAEAEDTPLTLRDTAQTQVPRYTFTWTDWVPLSSEAITRVVTAGTSIAIDVGQVVPFERTGVYVNGLAQAATAYSTLNTVVTITGVKPGDAVTVLLRAYEPTAAELAFDPDTNDNLKVQEQYKQDWSYVVMDTRDVDGAITGRRYYFWVKNKITAAKGKKQSVQAITRLLAEGPSNYLTFQGLLPEVSGEHVYHALTISGLNYTVTKDDTFKLRFLRNFILRDDPEDINLKNYHAEWTLIRRNAKLKIPEALWLKLTDSLVGADTAGNPLPALNRVLYDERNSTREQFGFGPEQVLAPADLLRVSAQSAILNSALIDQITGLPSTIEALDYGQSDTWFDTPTHCRETMTTIWTTATPEQINDVFFSVLDDILASNYELTHLFKTSRISANSIKVVRPGEVEENYE